MTPDTPAPQRPLELETPASSPASTSTTRPKYTPPPYHHTYWRQRIPLVALEAFVTLTAIYEAAFSLPGAWRQNGLIAPFADSAIFTLALVIVCGGGALIALISVLAWPSIGALASMVAGAAVATFALVEMLIVGFTAVMTPAQPVVWFRLFYIVAGLAIVLLGARLWKAETGAYRFTWQALRRGMEGGAA